MGSKFSIRAIWNTARCEFIKLIIQTAYNYCRNYACIY